MNKRDFLKTSVFASGMVLVPSFLKGMEFLTPEQLSGYKNVIIIQLSGGNDGLNTIIPYRDDLYHKKRPTLRKKGKEVLTLSDSLGINSNLLAIKKLYDQGEVAVVNNVGYPNPNRSHFRSTDIWQTASDANQYLATGWVGRYLDANCSFPYQSIEVDDSLSLALKGTNMNGIALTDANKLFNSTREPFFQDVAANVKNELLNEENQGYLYKTLLETYSSASYIKETSKLYTTKVTYPNTKFAKHLKVIGDFINSGLKTRVYYSSLGGFDSHVNQKNQQDRLLKTYSEAMDALVKDLKQTDRFKDTLILTFSEFGRRVQQNASLGTDHGTANNVTIIGGGLKKAGILNEDPNLSELDKNGDLKFTVDFRSIYATILHNWLEVNDEAILNQKFERMKFI